MKKLIYILLLVSASSTAQQRSVLSLVQSPNSLEDGVSLGIQFEHQNNVAYVGLELYSFPNLNDINYNHLITRVGLNTNFEKTLRLYSGVRMGAILRSERIYPMLGLEAGFDINITDNFFVGFSYGSDMKTESKLWSTEDYHTVNSGFVRIGFKI